MNARAELLDVLDADGNITGQLDKAAIHDQGLWHKDVHVWITNGTDMLQQQRAWDKLIMPGAWDIAVGGHVAAGESYQHAAVRETAEELGILLRPELYIPAGRLAVDMAMEPNGWRHRTIGEHFVLLAPGLQVSKLELQQSEVIGARWYDIDQLESDLARPETAALHAPQLAGMWALGIAAMRAAAP